MKKVSILIIIVLGTIIVCFAQADQPPWLQVHDAQFYEWQKVVNSQPPQQLDSEAEHNYDVKAYHINLYVDLINEYIQGYCTVTMESTIAGLTEVELDLVDLTVTACEVDGSSTTFSQSSFLVTAYLPTPQNPGTDFDVTVYYQGNPTHGMYFRSVPVCSTHTEPCDSRFWYPCYDDPSDKTDYSDVTITVDGEYIVVSNGLEVSCEYSGGRTTSHWHESHPIPTYLIAFSVADYSVLVDSYQGMPLIYYVFPGDEDQGWSSLADIKNMLDLFNKLFSPYPFTDEKYAVVDAVIGGMEHTTCTFLSPSSPTFNQIHELAHQWWGDWVTLGTWMDVWLNEGFAEYSEPLYMGHIYGDGVFQAIMENYAEDVFNYGDDYPIYSPYNFGNSYYKGAWVLHMIRGIFDDDQFFQMLRNYGNTYAYSTAVTEDFKNSVEADYGGDLDWFFEEWVYLAGHPELELWWVADGNDVTLHLEQVQEVDDLTPIFQMPVDIRLTTTAGEEDFNIWMSQEVEEFELTASADVVGLEFDPDNWLLDEHQDTTDVELRYFTAYAAEEGINLIWKIYTDEQIYGFNLYRRSLDTNLDQVEKPTSITNDTKPSGGWSKINQRPITGENPYSYLNRGVKEGERYEYRLEVIISAGTKTLANTEVVAATPKSFALMQNYPNPWSETTTVTFTLPEDCEIILGIYDISGRLVKEVLNGYYRSGEHQLTLNNSQMNSGVYILRLANKEQVAFSKMVFIK